MNAYRTVTVLTTIALTLAGCTPAGAPAATSTTPPTLNLDTRPASSPTATRALPTPTATPLPSPTPDFVSPLIDRMSVEEKVGQLFVIYSTQPEFDEQLEAAIVEDHVAGIILFGSNVEHPAQVTGLINQAQAAAIGSGTPIPLLVAIDQEGGLITRLYDGFTQFPGNMALGATQDPTCARLMARTMAQEMRAVGINMNLAPVLDVNSNPQNPVIGTRSFGGSPDLVTQMGLPMIETYREQGIIATAKHFPGHGDTEIDSHHSLPSVTHPLERLWAVELAPFQAAIDAGVDVVMTAHVHFPALDPLPGQPATLSPLVLQDLLRTEMGFQGVIATDSLGMGALSETYDASEVAVLALQAGADLLMFGKDPGIAPAEARQAYAHVLSLVRSGEIPLERVETSVRRILTLKAHYDLLTWHPLEPEAAAQLCGTPEHAATARQVALDGITLLSNDGVLPLATDQSVLLIVPRRVIDLDDALRAHFPGLRVATVDLNPTARQISRVAWQARSADAVVIATWDASWHPRQVSLVERLERYSPVVVALNTPFDLAALEAADAAPAAYVCAYSDSASSLEALALVLSGAELPRGRLPAAVGDAYPTGYGWSAFERPPREP